MGANAGTAVPVYVSGQVLDAARLNLTNCGVPVFATTTTRDAAFGGTGEKTLAEGQMCYIEAAPKRLQVYNGTAWIDYDAEWTTFTPTFTTGYVRGNGTTSSAYVRIGKTVVVSIQETLGSTSSVTGLLTVTLPLTASNSSRVTAYGIILDPGLAIYSLLPFASSTTALELYVMNAATTNVTGASPSATNPMTWATNDLFRFTVVYEIA